MAHNSQDLKVVSIFQLVMTAVFLIPWFSRSISSTILVYQLSDVSMLDGCHCVTTWHRRPGFVPQVKTPPEFDLCPQVSQCGLCCDVSSNNVPLSMGYFHIGISEGGLPYSVCRKGHRIQVHPSGKYYVGHILLSNSIFHH